LSYPFDYSANLLMWTLVIIVLSTGGPSGGSSSAVSSMVFQNQAQCSAAGAQLSGIGNLGGDKGGTYQIIAKCIERIH